MSSHSPITRTSGTMHPGARQRARVWAVATDPRKRWPHRHGECVQVSQQLEPEATTKSSNHISFIFFFPSLQENILNKSTQIRVQPHSAFLWHFPNPPCLHIHLRARPFRHPAARACHNTWERESRRKQMADGGKRIFH